MIEIELKYELNITRPVNLNLSEEKVVEDIYYDTNDYTLLKNGNFLRVRNGKQLDFKLNAHDNSHLYCKETNFGLANDNINKIPTLLKKLDVKISFNNINELLDKLIVLAPIKKKRLVYKLEDNVTLVIDEVENIGTFLEIEYDLLKDNITKEEGQYYKEYLIKILKEKNLFNLLGKEVHIGYVELYLKKYNIEAYNIGIYHD